MSDAIKAKLIAVAREVIKGQKQDLAIHIQRLASVLAEYDTEEADPRTKQIRDLASEQCYQEGVVEVDDDAVVSEGSDNGAYVQAWVWVDFTDTPLDRCCDECLEVVPKGESLNKEKLCEDCAREAK